MATLSFSLARFCSEVLDHTADQHARALAEAAILSPVNIIQLTPYEPVELRALFTADGTDLDLFANLDVDLHQLLSRMVCYCYYLQDILHAPLHNSQWIMAGEWTAENPTNHLVPPNGWDKSSFLQYYKAKGRNIFKWILEATESTNTITIGDSTPYTPRKAATPPTMGLSNIHPIQAITGSSIITRFDRRPLSYTIKWSGELATFQDFERSAVAHWSSYSMDYFLAQKFRAPWELTMWSGVQYVPEVMSLGLTEIQVNRDRRMVYGGITSALVKAKVSLFHLTNKYLDSKDGFKLWYEIHDEFTSGYDVRTRRRQLEGTLHKMRWNSRRMGLPTFFNKADDSWARLAQLKTDNPKLDYIPPNEEQKREYFMQKFQDTELASVAIQVDHATEDKTFKEFRDDILARTQYQGLQGVTHQAGETIDDRKGQQATQGSSEVNQYIRQAMASLLRQSEDDREAFRAMTLNDQAVGILRGIPYKSNDGETLFDVFQEQRKKIRIAEDALASATGEAATQKGNQSNSYQSSRSAIPRQYSSTDAITKKAYAISTGNEDTNEEDETVQMDNTDDKSNKDHLLDGLTALIMAARCNKEDSDMDDAALQLAGDRFAGNITVRCHTEYENVVHAHLACTEDGPFFGAMDTGADSCIGGKWTLFFAFTGHYANILGFDSNYAKKKNCPIGSMAMKVRLRDGKPAIIIIHQAVQNKDSETTLMSVYQIRENGGLVDPTAKHHKTIDNKTYGQQCWWLDPTDPNTKIDLVVQAGLTGPMYEQCLMEDLDNDDIPKFEVTSNQPWKPQDHYDNGIKSLQPLNSAQSVAVAQQIKTITNLDGAATAPVPDTDPFEEFADTTQFDLNDPDLPDSLYYFDPEDTAHDKLLDTKQDRYTFCMSTKATDWVDQELQETGEFQLDPCWMEPEEQDDVDYLLSSEDNMTLLGYSEPFDTYAYGVAISAAEAHAFGARTSMNVADASKLRRFFSWLPTEVVRRTIECTHQSAMMKDKFPFTRHVKSLYPWTNRKQLDETIATDTVFSNVVNIGGATCAQVYYGLTSHVINVHGLKKESDNDESLADFLREEGMPKVMRSDCAKSEMWGDWLKLLRKYLIRNEHSEPRNQQQNPCELRAVRWLKEHAKVLMRRTGAPAIVWLEGLQYLADVHNHTADETLGWTTPKRRRTGIDPDVSPFLQFQFMERVTYYDCEEAYPATRELTGYWVGIAWNIGDILTYKILQDDMETIVPRSIVTSAYKNPNRAIEHTANFGLEPQIDGVVPPPIDDDDRSKWPPIDDDDRSISATGGNDIEDEDDDSCSSEDSEIEDLDVNINVDPEHPDNLLEFSNGPLPEEPTILEHHRARRRDKREQRKKKPTRQGQRQSKRITRRENIANIAKQEKFEDPVPSTIAFSDDFVVTPLGCPVQSIEATIQSLGQIEDINDALQSIQAEDLDNIFNTTPKAPKPPSPNLAYSGQPTRDARSKNNIAKAHTVEATIKATPIMRKKIPSMTKLLLGILPLVATCFQLHPIAPMQEATLHITQAGQVLKDAAIPTIPDYSHKNMTKAQTTQLAYVLACDAVIDDLDPTEQRWTPRLITEHRTRIIRNPRDKDKQTRSTNVLVHWWDDDEPATWEDINAIRLSTPFLLIDYAEREGITSKWNGWNFLSDYDAEIEATLRQAFKAVVQGETQRASQFMFGVEVPYSVRNALALDEVDGNHLWQEAIGKELKQINDFKTFRAVKKGENLRDFQRIPYHMVFANKVDGRRKARLVAGGNHTETPKEDIFSGVVGIENVRLTFLISQMNGYHTCAADISSAFLYAKTKEKCFIVAGKEFGPEAQGKPLIIDKGLYGLKSSSARFHEVLSAKIRSMGYLPSKADHDLWMKRHEDGHYSYIATYIDDVIAYDYDPMTIIQEIRKDYMLKGVGVPEFYLGGDVLELDECWHKQGIYTGLGAETYVKSAVSKFERIIERPLAKYDAPMDSKYHPEEDDSPFLDKKQASLFRGLVGSANWLITLGRFDIHYATNALSRWSMAPREGHITAMFRVFGYLKKYQRAKILVDASYPDHSKYPEIDYNWQEFYPDAIEEIPYNAPPSFGKKARITCYVDSDHAHDTVTRRSVSGILIFVNNMPIKWIVSRQKTVETSSYGSEMVAARLAVEAIIAIRYKLIMLGVPLDGPALMLGDNMSVVLSSTVPSSPLKKKHQAINFHRIREAIAAKIIRFAHIRSEENIADVLNKPLPPYQHRYLIGPVLFRRPPIAGTPRSTGKPEPMIDDLNDGVIRRLEETRETEAQTVPKDKNV